jgi:hypothetical protein
MHTEGCAKDEAKLLRDRYEKLLSRPVLLPIQEGVDKLIPALKTLVETEKKQD